MNLVWYWMLEPPRGGIVDKGDKPAFSQLMNGPAGQVLEASLHVDDQGEPVFVKVRALGAKNIEDSAPYVDLVELAKEHMLSILRLGFQTIGFANGLKETSLQCLQLLGTTHRIAADHATTDQWQDQEVDMRCNLVAVNNSAQHVFDPAELVGQPIHSGGEESLFVFALIGWQAHDKFQAANSIAAELVGKIGGSEELVCASLH